MLPRVTDAPGIAALVASMTVPTIAPYEVCARTGVRLPIKSAAAIAQPAAKRLYRSVIGSSSSHWSVWAPERFHCGNKLNGNFANKRFEPLRAVLHPGLFRNHVTQND